MARRVYDDIATRRALALALRLSWRADRWRTAAKFGTSVGQSIAWSLQPLGLKLLVDAAIARRPGDAAGAVAFIAVLHGVGLLGDWHGFMLGMRLRESIVVAVDLRIIELTTGVPGIEHLERPDYADELLLLRNERELFGSIVDAVTNNVAVAVSATTTIGLLASVHPALALLPVFGLPALWTASQATKASQAASDAMAEPLRVRNFTYGVVAKPSTAKELRVFGLADELTRRYDDSIDQICRMQLRAQVVVTAWTTAGWLAFALGYGGAIALVVTRAVDHRATLGQVVLALTLAASVNGHVSSAVAVVNWLLASLRNGRRLVWFEDYVGARQRELHPAQPALVPARLTEGISLEDVHFSYPGTERAVLEGVSVFLPAGSTVAIVGDNGAGKTTLVKLLGRFYEPTVGSILVDGTDISRFAPTEWRARVAAGFQDFARYELAARQTVGVGDLPALDDLHRIEQALSHASAAEVARDLPEGLSTLLGKSFDGGIELSGGQWQKLALARSMMRSAPLLLLLDEPTAALDAATEHALFERFASAAHRAGEGAGAITLIVSHRFSTVRMADLIIVVADGRVREAGDHETLLANAGLYAELYTMQAAAYR